MDGDHMGEHGKWVHGAETYLPKLYMLGGRGGGCFGAQTS